MKSVRYWLLMVIVFLLFSSTSSIVMFPATAQEDMAQVHKDTIRTAIAEYNSGNRDAFYDLMSEPFMMNQGDDVLHEMTRADIVEFDTALLGAMPDLQMSPDVLIAQDDWVAAEISYTGTFTEPFSFVFLPEPAQPTGAVIHWSEMVFLHFDASGKVFEIWNMSDPSIQFGQMGIMPLPEDGPGGTPLEMPAGYQTLSADGLAATYTSGMESRNLARLQEQLDLILTADTSGFYTDSYVQWSGGTPLSVLTSESIEEDMSFFALLSSAMPDLTLDAPIMVAEGDYIAMLARLTGNLHARH